MPKCKAKPNHTDSPRLEYVLDRIRTEIMNLEHKQEKTDNLTFKKRRALTELMTRTDIVINKADKGSTIVIEDRDEYIKWL